MIFRHKLHHFTVANSVLPRRVSRAVKRVFATVKLDQIRLEIIQLMPANHSITNMLSPNH